MCKPKPQDHAFATHTKKIKKEHGAIDWSLDAAYLARHVRAMSPWPTAYTFRGDVRLIVEEATAVAGKNGQPGAIVSLEPLRVATGDGALEVRAVRPEGKGTMTAREFVAGHRVAVGDVLTRD